MILEKIIYLRIVIASLAAMFAVKALVIFRYCCCCNHGEQQRAKMPCCDSSQETDEKSDAIKDRWETPGSNKNRVNPS